MNRVIYILHKSCWLVLVDFLKYIIQNKDVWFLGYPAFKGAFIGNFTIAEVRVKAWGLHGLNTARFERNASLISSKSQGEFPLRNQFMFNYM
jgi:hypothetical protein